VRQTEEAAGDHLPCHRGGRAWTDVRGQEPLPARVVVGHEDEAVLVDDDVDELCQAPVEPEQRSVRERVEPRDLDGRTGRAEVELDRVRLGPVGSPRVDITTLGEQRARSDERGDKEPRHAQS
jgi:hypothetical protein